MMHQQINTGKSTVVLDDRPKHEMVIQKDEVTNLKIDLETMDPEDIFELYFS